MGFSFRPTGHSARVVRLAWLGVVLVMAGCANETGEHDASSAAARFLSATGGGDTRAACALLAPAVRDDLAASEGESCEDALPADRLRGAVTGVEVWSDRARVSTEGGTVFLTEFDDGWRITAAGCRPNGDAPYRCVVGD
jgi:hypothetical protein